MPSGPKSNKFMNRHAAEAMERDNERRSATQQAQQKAKEDAMWELTDSKDLKKLEKQREQQAKLDEAQRRKAESQAQLDEEERQLDKNKMPAKVSKKALQREMAKLVASYDQEVAKVRGGGGSTDADDKGNNNAPLPKGNLNRDETGKRNDQPNVVYASGVSGAIGALQSDTAADTPDDRHIGKRARVLYRLFCDEQLPALKDANRGLRRTQYNDLLWALWQKSPQNPFVRRNEQRSADRLEEERRWMEGGSDEEGEEAEESKAK